MFLTDAHGRQIRPHPAYQLGSYCASTPVTTVTVGGLQRQFDALVELRNQITHAPSVFVNHSPAAFNGEQPDFLTVILPGREHLPNHVQMGGAAETFVAGTSRSVPAIGGMAHVIPYVSAQANESLAGAFATYSLSTSASDRCWQFTWVPSSQDARQYVLSEVPLVSGASATEPTGIQESGRVEPYEADTEATLVELRLDEVPGLRAYLLHLIKRQRASVGRRLRRCRTMIVPRPRPARRNSTLAALAVSRRFGRRSEPDDDALPAHQWTSVIRGEPALIC